VADESGGGTEIGEGRENDKVDVLSDIEG